MPLLLRARPKAAEPGATSASSASGDTALARTESEKKTLRLLPSHETILNTSTRVEWFTSFALDCDVI